MFIGIRETEISGGPSTNAELANAILRRRVVIENVADDLANRVGGLYAQAARETAARIEAAAARGATPERFAQNLRGRVAGELTEIVRGLMPKVGREMGETLREVYRVENLTGVAMLRHAIPDDALAQISVVRPPAGVLDVANMRVLGTSLDRWGEKARRDLLDKLGNEIAVGALVGDDMRQMTARTAKVFGEGGRRATLTARTAVQTVSTEAHAELFDANLDILSGVQHLATLDRRLCPVCAGLDGMVYRVSDGSYRSRPRLPLHPHCRCVYTPVTKSWAELGANRREVSPGSRASMDGQVAGPVSLEKWLKKQKPNVAVSILGPTRAALWREGKFSLSDFVPIGSDLRHPVTVEELLDRLEAATIE